MGFDFKDFSIVPVLQDEVLFVMLDANGDDISECLDVSVGDWIFFFIFKNRWDSFWCMHISCNWKTICFEN